LSTVLVSPRGHIANIELDGCVASYIDDLWPVGPAVTSGAADTYSIPALLRLVASRRLDVGRFVTHRYGLGEFDEAYDACRRKAETGALKVVLSRAFG
jgi:alcohol dehydrogenase